MQWKGGLAVLGLSLGWCVGAVALDASGKRYVDLMVNGGPSSIRTAAEGIFNTVTSDQEVLDVAAETLLQGYQKGVSSESQMDAMAWLCRALGNSGNGRYKAAVSQAAASESRKLKRHCGRAAGDLPDPQAGSYQAGSVDLAKYRAGGSGAAAPAAAAKPAAAPAGGAVSFDAVKEGMSMEEVNSLIGQPTATTSHMTGKAWAPFNFKGKDTVRLIALYKGVGRIIYSKESHYTSTFRVMELVRDPAESGYP